MKKTASETPAVIIAGGQAHRMGGVDKCLLTVGGSTILSRIVDTLSQQASPIFLNTNGDAQHYSEYNLPIIADQTDAPIGPLGGLFSAMHYLKNLDNGFDACVTVTGDTPFIPIDLVKQLLARKSAADHVIFCASNHREHFISALWSLDILPQLSQFIADGNRSVHRFIATLVSKKVIFSSRELDPFFNINTEEDLALANSLYEGSCQ